jgi:TonB family protein
VPKISVVTPVVLALLFSGLSSVAQERDSGTDRKVLSRVVPAYPELAKKMGIQGKVRVVATVGPNGKVKLTQVLGGNPVLAKAAEDAVAKWKFAEATAETREVIELRFNPD